MINKLLAIIALLFIGAGLPGVLLQAQKGSKPVSATEIDQAVTAGDLNKVRSLVEADSTYLELKNNEGNTALIIACKARQEIDESHEGGLANGRLNSKELAGQKIIVMITHWAGQDLSALSEAMPDASFVLSFSPDNYSNAGGGLTRITDKTRSSKIPPNRLAKPSESYSINGVIVNTTPEIMNQAQGESLGYLAEADGLKVFYAGLMASDKDSLHIIQYHKDIDRIKPFGPVFERGIRVPLLNLTTI